MPTLHRFGDRPGYYIRGVSNGKPLALELTTEGVSYMTETLALAEGGKFAGETFKWLYKKKWAIPLTQPLPDEPVVVSSGPVEKSGPDANPVLFPGSVQLRLFSGDHVALDQSVQEIVQTLAATGANIAGPIPLPVHLETYMILRDQERKAIVLRQYERLLQVRNPRQKTIDVMREFSLPREVHLTVAMKPNG